MKSQQEIRSVLIGDRDGSFGISLFEGTRQDLAAAMRHRSCKVIHCIKLLAARHEVEMRHALEMLRKLDRIIGVRQSLSEGRNSLIRTDDYEKGADSVFSETIDELLVVAFNLGRKHPLSKKRRKKKN